MICIDVIGYVQERQEREERQEEERRGRREDGKDESKAKKAKKTKRRKQKAGDRKPRDKARGRCIREVDCCSIHFGLCIFGPDMECCMDP